VSAGDLSALRNRTLLLRLVVAADGQLSHGTVLDDGGEPVAQFRSLVEVAGIVERWLAGPSGGASHAAGSETQEDAD
jgi:hypothetical protein